VGPEPFRTCSLLWRRVDRPGHECARLSRLGAEWHLSGCAVFLHEARACRLDYLVICDARWHTRAASVSGWIGDDVVHVNLIADAAHRWIVNGTRCPQVDGCIDLDLNFSPSTNLLPIRRLQLAPGESAEVTAAWLRFPGFVLEPLTQRYTREGDTNYRYESAGGAFVAVLDVNAVGLVTRYPRGWEAEVVQ
jgi:hypothetical protein